VSEGWEVQLLQDSERRTTSVQWPAAVDERLETLLRLLKAEATPASRAQLLAALVATAPLDGPRLARVMRTYRRMRRDEFDAVPAEALPVLRHPGPRRRT
jgi:hypothetical protein